MTVVERLLPIIIDLKRHSPMLAEQRLQNVCGEIIYGLKCAKRIHAGNYKKEEYPKLNQSIKRSFELIGNYFHLFS